MDISLILDGFILTDISILYLIMLFNSNKIIFSVSNFFKEKFKTKFVETILGVLAFNLLVVLLNIISVRLAVYRLELKYLVVVNLVLFLMLILFSVIMSLCVIYLMYRKSDIVNFLKLYVGKIRLISICLVSLLVIIIIFCNRM